MRPRGWNLRHGQLAGAPPAVPGAQQAPYDVYVAEVVVGDYHGKPADLDELGVQTIAYRNRTRGGARQLHWRVPFADGVTRNVTTRQRLDVELIRLRAQRDADAQEVVAVLLPPAGAVDPALVAGVAGGAQLLLDAVVVLDAASAAAGLAVAVPAHALLVDAAVVVPGPVVAVVLPPSSAAAAVALAPLPVIVHHDGAGGAPQSPPAVPEPGFLTPPPKRVEAVRPRIGAAEEVDTWGRSGIVQLGMFHVLQPAEACAHCRRHSTGTRACMRRCCSVPVCSHLCVCGGLCVAWILINALVVPLCCTRAEAACLSIAVGGRFTFVGATTLGYGGAVRAHYLCNACKGRTDILSFTSKNGTDWGTVDATASQPSAAVQWSRGRTIASIARTQGAAAAARFRATIPVAVHAQGNNVSRQRLVSHLLTSTVWSWKRYRLSMLCENLTPMGKPMFSAIVRELAACLALELREQIELAHIVVRARCPRAVIAADGVYLNRGSHSANMSTLAVNLQTGLVVGVVHLCQRATSALHFVVPHSGTAKAAESTGVGVLCDFLKKREVDVGYFVVDGDTSVANTALKAFPHATIVPCFNHQVRALCHRLDAAVNKRSVATASTAEQLLRLQALVSVGALQSVAVAEVPSEYTKCTCPTRHRRTATGDEDACGCPTTAHSKKLRMYMHAIASTAGDSAERYTALLQQLQRHIGGDHSTCEFHAARRCAGECEPRCRTVACCCTTPGCRVAGSGVLACWGTPVEPKCAGVPWESRSVPSITCPFHNLLFIAELQREQSSAAKLIIKELGKVMVRAACSPRWQASVYSDMPAVMTCRTRAQSKPSMASLQGVDVPRAWRCSHYCTAR
jgi:hypothetical protein